MRINLTSLHTLPVETENVKVKVPFLKKSDLYNSKKKVSQEQVKVSLVFSIMMNPNVTFLRFLSRNKEYLIEIVLLLHECIQKILEF